MSSYSTRASEMRPPPAIGLLDLLAIAWRRQHQVWLCVLAALAVGALYDNWAQPTYEVRAKLLVEKKGLALAEGELPKPLRDLEFLATQAEIVRSPAVVSRAAAAVAWPATTESPVSSTRALIEALSVRPVMGTSVLSLSVRASDAALATDGLAAVIASYRQYLNDRERQTHSTTLELLTRTEKELRSELQALDDQYASLRADRPLGGKGEGGVDVHMALVVELGRQLAEVRNQRIQLENQLVIAARGWSAPEGPTPVTTRQVAYAAPLGPERVAAEPPLTPVSPEELAALPAAASADVAAVHARLVEAQLREKNLEVRYGEKHPDLRGAREQVARLRREYAMALEVGAERLRQQFAAVTASERHLDELYRKELETARAIDQFVVEEQQLCEQTQRVQTLHDSILDQIRTWKLSDEAVADGQSRVHVALLEEPTLPQQPVWPDRKLLFGLCGLIGLVSATGLMTVSECRLRGRLVNEDDVPEAVAARWDQLRTTPDSP